MTKPRLPPPKKNCTFARLRYVVRRRTKSAFFAYILICTTSFGNCLAEETVYKYEDYQGGTIYSDTPPADGARNVEVLKQEPGLIKRGKGSHSNTYTNSRPNTSQSSPKPRLKTTATTGYPLWQVGLFLILLIIPAALLQFYVLPRLRGNSFQQATIGVLAKNHLPAQHNLKLTLESGKQTVLPHLIHDHSGLVCLHNKPQADAAGITKAIEKLSDGVPVYYILLVEDKADVDCESEIRISTLSDLRKALLTLPVARYTPGKIEAAFTYIRDAQD